MKKIVKQVCGIDVAHKELVVCFGTLYEDFSQNLSSAKTFANTPKGCAMLLSWAKKQAAKDVPLRFAMEATGVYHEQLAYFLDDHEQEVSIILPNKISNYFRTLEVKTINDDTSSQAIAKFALERHGLKCWKRPNPIYRQLRNLSRERDQVVQERTIVKNQLHAELAKAFAETSTIKRLKSRIQLLDKHEMEIKAEMAKLAKSDPEVHEAVTLLKTIKGLGELTATIILAETDGFALIKCRRQLASYAGFDVKDKLSGTSVKGKARISKRGNKYLRKAMYSPAMAAARFNEKFKQVYARTVARNGCKMKAAVAVQRRLLEMAYIIFKNKTLYDPAYTSSEELQPA
jgi:transposase